MQKQPFTLNVINPVIKVAIPSGIMNAFEVKIRQSIKVISKGYYISKSDQIVCVNEETIPVTVFMFFSEDIDASINDIAKMVDSILTFDKYVFIECGSTWHILKSNRKQK
jgi:hypothetical protein